MKNDFLTIQQAANLVGVSTKTLRRWEANGKLIPQRTIGNQRRYLITEIELLKERKQTPVVSSHTQTNEHVTKPAFLTMAPALLLLIGLVMTAVSILSLNAFSHKPLPSSKHIARSIDHEPSRQPSMDTPRTVLAEDTSRLALPNAISTTSTNLIQSSSFELESGGKPRGWYYLLDSTTGNTFISQEGNRSGKFGLKFVGGDSGNFGLMQPDLKTVPRRTYRFSAYVKVVNAPTISLKLGFWNEYLNKEGEEKTFSFSGTNDWQRISMTTTTPGILTDPKNEFPLFEVLGLTSGSVYFDDIQLEEGSTLAEYNSAQAKPSAYSIIGDGSLTFTPGGDIYPTYDGVGKLGSSTNKFESLTLTKASIDKDGNLSVNGAGVKGDLTVDGNFTMRSGTTLLFNNLGTGILHTSSTGSVSASTVDLASSDVSGTLAVANGGTGATSLTQYGVLYGNGTSAVAALTPGTSGYVLQSNGTSAAPSWIAASSVGSSFSSLTSGTNTQAAMVVGSGASLTYSGGTATSGVINANQLLGSTWASPGSIGSTTANSGAFTTLSASGNVTLSGLTSGSIPFINSSNVLAQDNTNLFWDATNTRLGIGNNSSLLGTLDLRTTSGTLPVATISGKTSFASLVVDNAGSGDVFAASAAGQNRFVITQAGNVGIGTTSPAGILSVQGAASNGTLQISNGTNSYGIGFTSLGSVSAINGTITNTSFGLRTNNTTRIQILSGGNVGITTTTPLATFDVRANSGTIAIASASGSTSFTTLLADNSGSGDLFTASKSGATKFTILNNGNLSWAGQTNFLSTFASAATAARTWTLPDATGTLCISGQACATAGTVGFWQRNAGTLSPDLITDDLLIGGNASTSANFRVTGNSAFAGTTSAASVSANTSFAGLVVDNRGSGDIFTASSSGLNRFVIAQNGNVGIGLALPTYGLHMQFNDSNDSSKKGILIENQAAAGEAAVSFKIGNNGTNQWWTGVNSTTGYSIAYGTQFTLGNEKFRIFSTGGVQLGSALTQTELSTFHVRSNSATTSIASTSGSTNFAGLVVDNSGSGDLFSASKSGATKFTILNNGNLSWAGQTNFLSTFASAATAAQTWTLPDATGTICLSTANCSSDALWNSGSGALYPGNSTLDLLIGGTASTSANFKVTGNSAFAGTTSAASVSANTSFAGLVVDNKGSGDIFAASSSGLNRFVIAQNGNVGIGTAIPTVTLDVSGSIRVSSLFRSNSGLVNNTSQNNARVQTLTTGLVLDRNVADANPVVIIQQIHASSTGDILQLKNASSTLGVFSQTGSFGVGTTAPLATLDIRGNSATTPAASVSANSNFAAMVVDNKGSGDIFTASSSGLTRFVVKQNGDAQIYLNSQIGSGGQRLCHNGADGSNQGLVTLGDCNATSADYAEDYGTTDQTITAGDVVALDPTKKAEEIVKNGVKGSKAWILKATNANQAYTIGIVSTDPSDVIGKNFSPEENPRPVALSGRVPVKVSTENGLIKPGDFLATSSMPGVAMKATEAGQVIGKALASYDNPDPKTVGLVLTFINLSWYTPLASGASSLSLSSLTSPLSPLIASSSSELGLDSLDLKNATISGRLTVLGKTTLNDLGITGNITAGILSIHGLEGEINTIGEPLKLQAHGLAGIDLIAGKVTIDTKGNLIAKGEVTAKKFNVDTTDKLSASAGTAMIRAGKSEMIIKTTAVTENSLIYVTFADDYAPATRYWITHKEPNESFSIKLDASIAKDAKFNWWIVN